MKKYFNVILVSGLIFNLLPTDAFGSAGNIPTITAAYQNNDHARIEWAVDMADSDIIAQSGFEPGETYNLLAGGTGTNGGQSVTTEDKFSGNQSLKVVNTHQNANGYWYPDTWSDTSRFALGRTYGIPKGAQLSVTYKARTNVTGSYINPIFAGGIGKNTYPIHTLSYYTFIKNPVKFTSKATMYTTSFSVDNIEEFNQQFMAIKNSGGRMWIAAKKSNNYGIPAAYVESVDVATKTVKLYEGTPMQGDFSVGDDVLLAHWIDMYPGSRTLIPDNQWHTYNANVSVASHSDHEFETNGLETLVNTTTPGIMYIDDIKFGFATETELLRDGTSVYRGYLSDYEDYGAVDKVAPSQPNNVTVALGVDRRPVISWNPSTDHGSTYNYQIKAYPRYSSPSLSSTTPVTVTSGIKGYSIVIDQNPNTIPGPSITTTSTSYTGPTAADGNFYVHIAAVDNKNNTSNVVHIPYMDTVDPRLNITSNNESWTSESVQLTAVASDGETGVKRIKLPDGTWVNHATASYSVTQNGTFTFVAEDNAGNQTESNYTVSNIDNTAPTIQITPQSRSWSEEDIQIKIQYEDAQSGINPNKRQYKVTTSPEEPTDWDQASENEQLLTIQNEGTWYIHAKATDRVGHETTITTERLQLQEQPAAPDLQAYGIAENSATLEWTVPAASTYTEGYRYTVQNLTTGQSWEVEHPVNSFVDSSLRGGNTYQYQVVVTNHVGQSLSNPVEITTLPEKPSSVQVSKDGRAADRALVNISPVDSASSYRIVATDTVTQKEAFNQTVTDTVYQPINNLRPGSTYDIAVSAINVTGEGESAHIGFLTLPDTPAGFSGLEITEHTISLLWNSVNTATYYALERDEQLIYGGPEASYFDTGLESGTSYDYRVAAENETGFGEYATLDDVITLPARVEAIRSIASTTSDISFEWDAVQGADSYLLTINGEGDIRLPAETQQFTASGLASGGTYEIQVTASNRSGSGQSNSIVLSTLPDAPSEVLVQEIGEQEATVWIPEVQGATKYLLSVNGRTYETSSGEIVITGLSGGQNYPFTVAAGNMAGYGAATSGEFLTLPYMPNNVQAESTDHSIEMSWDAVPSATSYVVYDS
ncbi:fibronectin type III domain-containing protein, partial [Paenibacillus provencensis]